MKNFLKDLFKNIFFVTLGVGYVVLACYLLVDVAAKLGIIPFLATLIMFIALTITIVHWIYDRAYRKL